MRLSEAIRLGAMISPQTRGYFFRRAVSDKESVVATCALGAAALAVGGPVFSFAHSAYDTWPILAFAVPEAELPSGIARSRRSLRLADVIIMLNDKERWTRTEIAGWVERFEENHLSEASPSGAFAQAGEPEAAGVDDPEEEGAVPVLL
jgi:hypothetical protein